LGSEWPLTQNDTRTFATQQQRTLDDLNRPDLSNIVASYLQDSMRWYQRKTFFFNDTDNSFVPGYQNGIFYTQGATIQVLVSGTIYAMVALNAGISQVAGAPSWTTVQFTPPNQNNPPSDAFPPPPVGTQGTTTDNLGPNQIIWANNGPYQQGSTTGFTTVYFVNQYQMPIDLIKLNLVEVTWQGNLRIVLPEFPYSWIRMWDVIRPFPPATYPENWAWYNQQIYFWPYPSGLYPITLSYRSAPPLAQLPTDSNVWTTQFEAGIRYYAEGLLNKNLIHDTQAADDCFALSQTEFLNIQSQKVAQDDQSGAPPSDW
jgi:hypothetical protein